MDLFGGKWKIKFTNKNVTSSKIIWEAPFSESAIVDPTKWWFSCELDSKCILVL